MTTIYHEKQERLRCGIHALNNVLQARVFDQQQIDAACLQLVQNANDPVGEGTGLSTAGSVRAWLWNPHRSALGLGNYDVNALMLVLQDSGYSLQWIDKRQRLSPEAIDFDAVEGVLCNVVTLGGLFSRIGMEQRHWFALKKIDGVCFNLDSKLPAPAPFGGDDECRRFLQELLDTGECELFLVTKAEGKERLLIHALDSCSS